MRSIRKSGSTHDSCVLWIAEQRNFLPIRKVAFTHRWSATIPIGESIARDLREIKPGVWFPFNVETTAYNGIAIQREHQQKLQWREKCIVKTAELNPEYDKEFFSNVDFPDGTAMSEVESGKIKRSWTQGDR